jgi:hypothetical protein
MHSSHVRSIWIVSVVLFLTALTAAAAQSKICFYVDSPHAPLPTGHAFIQLLPGSGPDAGRKDLVFGHHPKSPDPFTSGGETQPNDEHTWDWKICYPVSDDQYNAVARFINKELREPSDFHLFGNNCTKWITHIAELAGLDIPRTKDPSNKNIYDPAVFEDNLKKIGDGKKAGGGTVHANTKHVTPKDSADPPAEIPDVCSCAGLTAAGFQSPEDLAKHLEMQLERRELEPERARMAQQFTLRVLNVDPNNALIAIDFGDGTALAHDATVSHTWRLPTEYRVRVFILTSGSVNLFTFPIVIGDEFGEGTKSISVPRFEVRPRAFPPASQVPSPALIGRARGKPVT